MTDCIATTPFGGAGVFVRHFARRQQVAEQQADLRAGEAGASSARADKWQLIRALTEAKAAFSLSDRSIAVLEALASFHPDREIDGAAPLIVFPSNRQLSLRCRGMSPATIRRHLAALVEAGLIFRKDSPNGKRYCRRGADGAQEESFGFDLAPLALSAAAIHERAEAVRAEERLRQKLRCEVSLHLRDIAKTLQAALNEAREGDWSRFEDRLAALSGRVCRKAAIEDLTARKHALLQLRAELEKAYLQAVSPQELSASACQFEHHIQIPEKDRIQESVTEMVETQAQAQEQRQARQGDEMDERTSAELERIIPIDRVTAACPQMADYSRNGIRSRSDLLAAAALVRPMLRISPSIWQRACNAMGEGQAAIALAAILERAEQIRSAGSYLKTLATKAETGAFSVLPMLQALEQKQASGPRPQRCA